MSPTPEKADVCPSKSAFPGEPTYHCSIAGWHPHKLHDDGEHHRWFDAIPDLPIHAWQATFLEQMLGDGIVPPRFMMTGHANTDRVLLEQAERSARAFDDLRLAELRRQTDAKIREIASNVQMPQHYWPAEYASLEDLTAELRRLDHEIANVRMLSAPYPLSEATLRERREAVRKEREKREAVEAWYGAVVPRYPYATLAPRLVSFAEALADREAPRLAQFEAFREAFASPFQQMMEAATKGGDEVAKKKIEDLHLPKVEYTYREGTNTLVPADPEAAKVDHVMTRHGGEIFGIARVSKEPIPDGTTIRTEKTEDLHIGLYDGERPSWAEVEWKEPTPLAEAHQAEALEKLVAATSVPLTWFGEPDGEVRTTSGTGGQKGVKPQRFDLIPVMPLTKLAEHYGIGAAKYADHNWRKGYEISKNYAALQRHVTAFWDGEDLDPETGSPHLAAVTFHAFAMMQTLEDFPQHDDRYKKEA